MINLDYECKYMAFMRNMKDIVIFAIETLNS